MARQHPKPNWSTPSFHTSHSFQHPSPAEARGMEMLLPEAVMESHERRMGSRWPWLCPECGSGSCEFCSCHLPKRAVELLQRGAISYGLASFIPMDLS